MNYRLLLRGAAAAVLVAGLSLGAETADAATITGEGSTLRYTAQPGEANDITLTAEGRTLVLVDTGASPSPSLPSYCTQDPGFTTLSVRCDTPGDWTLRIDLGDGDDWLEAEPLPRRYTLRVDAGLGENVVAAGNGDDDIVGGPEGDTLYGGYGNDFVNGGEGTNYVRGNPGDDDLRSGSDIDFVIGDSGDDVLRTGAEVDFAYAGAGNDLVVAGPGPDTLDLGPGDDVGYGGPGLDEIVGGAGFDRMHGEEDDDLIKARDGEADRIDCGTGAKDVARVDAGEVDQARRTCERVREAETP